MIKARKEKGKLCSDLAPSERIRFDRLQNFAGFLAENTFPINSYSAMHLCALVFSEHWEMIASKKGAVPVLKSHPKVDLTQAAMHFFGISAMEYYHLFENTHRWTHIFGGLDLVDCNLNNLSGHIMGFCQKLET